jgi:hypothetical protein
MAKFILNTKLFFGKDAASEARKYLQDVKIKKLALFSPIFNKAQKNIMHTICRIV